MNEPNTDTWLIFSVPTEQKVRIQLYQALFQIEGFRRFSALLHEEKATLDARNYQLGFARDLGIARPDRVIAAEMMAAKSRVVGLLGVTISSAHKFLRTLKQARKHDRVLDWTSVRSKVDELEDLYRRARNACEHLDERIYKGEYTSDRDFSFTVHNKLYFVDPTKGRLELNFSSAALGEILAIWDNVHELLRATRKRA
jgi:hypothetical protein